MKKCLSKLCVLTVVVVAIMTITTSCYRMPGENDYSVVPCINNPDITHERPNTNFAPNMGY